MVEDLRVGAEKSALEEEKACAGQGTKTRDDLDTVVYLG
jgi:hypothetical protein